MPRNHKRELLESNYPDDSIQAVILRSRIQNAKADAMVWERLR